MNEKGRDIRDIIKELSQVYYIEKLNGISHIRVSRREEHSNPRHKLLDLYPLAQRWHDVRNITRGNYTDMVDFINKFFTQNEIKKS